MSREIKFRAWDKDAGIFRYLILHDGNKFWTIMPANGNIGIWEQYTGLKDKNGLEIYEGDIIKYTGYARPAPESEYDCRTFVVEWCLAGFEGVPTNYYNLAEYAGGGVLEDWLMASDREVLGNIYENPELIEGDAEEVI